MKCKNCRFSRYNAERGIYFCSNYPEIDLDDDCRFLDKLHMINCSNCKFKESEIAPHCTKFNVIVHDNDGCTFGHRVVSNEEKFEEVFGIEFHEFVVGLKREDQLTWGISEYKEPPCEG